MKDEVVVHGVVLSEHSQREFDKRLHVLTMEEGKMTVWASGAKRPSSPLMAGSRSFVFGTFSLKKGKSGYNLQSVKVDAYFEEIALDLEKACYAAYFLELADFVSQENLPAEELVNLIYLSFIRISLMKWYVPFMNCVSLSWKESIRKNRPFPQKKQLWRRGAMFSPALLISYTPLGWKKELCWIFAAMWRCCAGRAFLCNFIV